MFLFIMCFLLYPTVASQRTKVRFRVTLAKGSARVGHSKRIFLFPVCGGKKPEIFSGFLLYISFCYTQTSPLDVQQARRRVTPSKAWVRFTRSRAFYLFPRMRVCSNSIFPVSGDVKIVRNTQTSSLAVQQVQLRVRFNRSASIFLIP